MAAEVFPVARIDEYAKPCEPAIHVLRSVRSVVCGRLPLTSHILGHRKPNGNETKWRL